MITFHKTICLAVALGGIAASSPLRADDGRRTAAVHINNANGLLRRGDVDAALKAYQQAQKDAPDRADLSYDMAVAQYRKGDMPSAKRLFTQVTNADDNAIAAKARYNLGNCDYASALRLADTDHAAAIKGFRQAIDNYRSALQIGPDDADARANIELAAAMINKLKDQDKKQEQQKNKHQSKNNDQKKQQQGGGQSNDQQQKNSQQQQSKEQQQQQSSKNQQQSKTNQQNQQQQKQSSESAQQKQQRSADKKKQQSDRSESKSKPQPSNSQSQGQKDNSSTNKNQPKDQNQTPPPQKSQSSSSVDKQPDQSQREAQPMSQQTLKNKRDEKNAAEQPDQPKDQQGKAAPKGKLTPAGQKAAEKQKDQKASRSSDLAPGDTMTKQEAEKMLQAIRDQEMIRRLRRQAAERNSHIPVDRDW